LYKTDKNSNMDKEKGYRSKDTRNRKQDIKKKKEKIKSVIKT